jgi:hypothetical protein
MPNRLLKTPTSLYKSCTGMLDLLLSYLSLRAVRLKNFEKFQVKQENLKYLGARTRAMCDVALRCVDLCRLCARAHRRVGRTTGPKSCVVGTVLLREVTCASHLGRCHVAYTHSPELARVPCYWLAARCLTSCRPSTVAHAVTPCSLRRSSNRPSSLGRAYKPLSPFILAHDSTSPPSSITTAVARLPLRLFPEQSNHLSFTAWHHLCSHTHTHGLAGPCISLELGPKWLCCHWLVVDHRRALLRAQLRPQQVPGEPNRRTPSLVCLPQPHLAGASSPPPSRAHL